MHHHGEHTANRKSSIMRLTGILGAVGATAALTGASLFMAIPASAASPASDAAGLCTLVADQLPQFGINQGECVNLVKGPASNNSNNFIAAICGIDLVQGFLGENKGQCIKTIRSLS
jgi:hypothetical protein